MLEFIIGFIAGIVCIILMLIFVYVGSRYDKDV